MGRHVGWRVIDRGTKARRRWRAMARNPLRKAYECRSFADKTAATMWARQRSTDLMRLAGRDDQAGFGPLLLRDVAPVWLDDLVRRGRSPLYVADCRQVLAEAEATITDLRNGPRCATQARMWWDGLRPLADQRTLPLSPATRNRRLQVLRACVHWSMRQPGYDLAADPLRGLARAQVPQRLKPVFEMHEARLLVSDAAISSDYGLFVALLLYTGLRLREGAWLDWSSVRWGDQRLIVRLPGAAQEGYRLKRERERVVPLQAELADLLRRRWQAAGQPAEGLIWRDVAGMQPDQHRRRFQTHLKACGIGIVKHGPDAATARQRGLRRADTHWVTPYTPHSTRHTWVTWVLATGEPESLVMLYAGHRDLQTTAGYAQHLPQVRQVVSAAGWGRGCIVLRCQ